MKNIIEDISNLTTIPEGSLTKLIDKAEWCIEDNIVESLLNNENTIELYIGIGKLVINIEDDKVKYRFVPTKHLERGIKESINTMKSPLENKVEQTLVDKILKTYKDLF